MLLALDYTGYQENGMIADGRGAGAGMVSMRRGQEKRREDDTKECEAAEGEAPLDSALSGWRHHCKVSKGVRMVKAGTAMAMDIEEASEWGACKSGCHAVEGEGR